MERVVIKKEKKELIILSFAFCSRCTEGYMGQRCEYKDLEGSYLRKDLFYLLSLFKKKKLIFLFIYFSVERENNAGKGEHCRWSHCGCYPRSDPLHHFLHLCPPEEERATP